MPDNCTNADVNPDTIASFTLIEGMFEIEFKDASRLKWPAKSCVYTHEGKIQMRVIPTLSPGIIINGGGKCADGKPRCTECDCLLDGDNRCGKFCINCAMELDEIAATAKVLDVFRTRKNNESGADRVRDWLLRHQPADASTLKADFLTKEIL